MEMRVGIARLAFLSAVYNTLFAAADEGLDNTDKEFFKPPSPCLMGDSCKSCIQTLKFYTFRVCCYHCRLDNVVISGDTCHCIDTRMPRSSTDIGGNCSSGQICDNCAVRLSTDTSQDATESPGTTNYCCQDCGIVMPFLYRDESGCHCEGDAQGREHQPAPRYDPTKYTTTAAPDTKDGAVSTCTSLHLVITSNLALFFLSLLPRS